ncbi:MAG: response regulator transcription factor [Granulosicoccus sp.]
MVAVLPEKVVMDVARESVIAQDRTPRAVSTTASNTENSVGVCASTTTDAARIARLLSFAGVNVSNIFFCELDQLRDVKAFAIVVCHRLENDHEASVLPDVAKVPRIIVVSDCGREETAVRFLNAGARHYFKADESDLILQTRLEAGLRSHRRVHLRSFVQGDIHFDVQKRKVTRAGQPVDLSPKEFEFACHLFSRLDKVVKNSELMTSVWSLPPDMDTRRIDTAACRVRKKLGLSREQGWELKRVRRVGYRLSRFDTTFEAVSLAMSQT